MSPGSGDVGALMDALESPRQEEAKLARARLLELFVGSKESWLVGGFVEYQLATGSTRAADLLAKVSPPHDKILLDRIDEMVRPSASSAHRVPALALLAHIVRREPSWLHKIPQHGVFKDLLQMLRFERDPVPLLSGLMILITLLPMVPTMVAQHFQDVFDVFGKLAAWDGRAAPYPHRDHLQLALFGLFQNLYGMYPCNFVDFLRREYSKKDNHEVFTHTVRPMLESVRMHPMLILSSKVSETDAERWKKMEHHDVVVECRRFSSESANRPRPGDEDGGFRSRCGTDVSSLAAVPQIQQAKSSNSTPNLTDPKAAAKSLDPMAVTNISIKSGAFQPGGEKWFSLVDACEMDSTLSAPQTPLPPASGLQEASTSHTPVSQIVRSPELDGGSPPEAAIEATPENTPIKDTRPRFNFPSSSTVKALNPRLAQPPSGLPYQYASSSSYSQPPSPLKKEASAFNRMYSVESGEEPQKDAFYAKHKLSRVIHDRTQQPPEGLSAQAPSPNKQLASPAKKVTLKDVSGASNLIPSIPNSPVPIGTAAPVSGTTDWHLAKPKPHKDGVPFDMSQLKENIGLNVATTESVNKEDKEVTELCEQSEIMNVKYQRDPQNLFIDIETKVQSASRQHQENESRDDNDEHWPEDETMCEGENKHCIEKKHGLHMPHSTSMMEMVRRAADRSRFHSQCIHEPSTSDIAQTVADVESRSIVCYHLQNKPVCTRKSLSCPENLITDINLAINKLENSKIDSKVYKRENKHEETQTIEVWPLDYEHLFTKLYENIYDTNTKSDSEEMRYDPERMQHVDLQRYIELSAQQKPKQDKRIDEITFLKQKLEIVQLELQYEKHRREIHAWRNRRLLGRSRRSRATEEENNALRHHIVDLTKDVNTFSQQVKMERQMLQNAEKTKEKNDKYWQQQLLKVNNELATERQEKARLSAILSQEQNVTNETSVDVQNLRATLFDVAQQLQRAVKKSEMSEKHLEFIKQLQRELLICGERDSKYRDILNMLPSKTDTLVNKLTQQYREQLSNVQSMLQNQTSKLEYWQARESELDATLLTKEKVIQELKKQLLLVKEEYNEKLKSVEEKYQSLKRINQRMEAYSLELLQRVPQSPQTLSRDLTSGFSPQSSPLSASLASSDGHGPLLASRVDEIKNLQVIVNAPETIEESSSNSVNNTVFEDENH